jgi:transketolase
MSAVGNIKLRLCGSHGGISAGEEGPSQMGLEDLAIMRAVHGSTVFYPCDAVQTVALVEHMLDATGMVYLRTTRGTTPVIYDPDESFPVGGSKLLRSALEDEVTIVAAGITVPEALAAYDRLKNDGITCRVIDAYTIKPIHQAALHEAANLTGRFVVVEDHWPEGGLGDAVLAALAELGVKDVIVRCLAVHEMPASASQSELLHAAGIDADGIVKAVKDIMGF